MHSYLIYSAITVIITGFFASLYLGDTLFAISFLATLLYTLSITKEKDGETKE